jgi:protein-S-isoprenylcysteine O-methyltransferase Ste14
MMGLKRQLTEQGNFLFRWRSYLPVAMIVPLLVANLQMSWPFGSHPLHAQWELVCLFVSLLGLLVRILVIGHTPAGTSGRNTESQVATILNTSGIYSVVRHPLYLGNFLIGLGPMLLPLIWWLPFIYALSFALYYERIMIAEEEFLKRKFGPQFDGWAVRTPAFIPNPLRWTRPSLPFSWKNTFKREYTAVAQIALSFFVLEVFEHYVIDGRLMIDPLWASIAVFGAFQYIILRSLKRYTGLLNVHGR